MNHKLRNSYVFGLFYFVRVVMWSHTDRPSWGLKNIFFFFLPSFSSQCNAHSTCLHLLAKRLYETYAWTHFAWPCYTKCMKYPQSLRLHLSQAGNCAKLQEYFNKYFIYLVTRYRSNFLLFHFPNILLTYSQNTYLSLRLEVCFCNLTTCCSRLEN